MCLSWNLGLGWTLGRGELRGGGGRGVAGAVGVGGAGAPIFGACLLRPLSEELGRLHVGTTTQTDASTSVPQRLAGLLPSSYCTHNPSAQMTQCPLFVMQFSHTCCCHCCCCCCRTTCRFTFADGQLTNSAAPQPKGKPPGKLSSSLVVEKVIVLGLDPARSYTATGGKKSYPVRSGAGVDPRLSKGKAVLVRTVDLPVNGDWSLKITVGKGVAEE